MNFYFHLIFYIHSISDIFFPLLYNVLLKPNNHNVTYNFNNNLNKFLYLILLDFL